MPLPVERVIAFDLYSREEGKPYWCDDLANFGDNLGTLIRWLACKGITANWTEDDFANLAEKPRRWQAEWDEMQAEFAKAEEADCA